MVTKELMDSDEGVKLLGELDDLELLSRLGFRFGGHEAADHAMDIPESAEYLGVNLQTMYRVMRNPRFRQEHDVREVPSEGPLRKKRVIPKDKLDELSKAAAYSVQLSDLRLALKRQGVNIGITVFYNLVEDPWAYVDHDVCGSVFGDSPPRHFHGVRGWGSDVRRYRRVGATDAAKVARLLLEEQDILDNWATPVDVADAMGLKKPGWALEKAQRAGAKVRHIRWGVKGALSNRVDPAEVHRITSPLPSGSGILDEVTKALAGGGDMFHELLLRLGVDIDQLGDYAKPPPVGRDLSAREVAQFWGVGYSTLHTRLRDPEVRAEWGVRKEHGCWMFPAKTVNEVNAVLKTSISLFEAHRVVVAAGIEVSDEAFNKMCDRPGDYFPPEECRVLFGGRERLWVEEAFKKWEGRELRRITLVDLYSLMQGLRYQKFIRDNWASAEDVAGVMGTDDSARVHYLERKGLITCYRVRWGGGPLCERYAPHEVGRIREVSRRLREWDTTETLAKKSKRSMETVYTDMRKGVLRPAIMEWGDAPVNYRFPPEVAEAYASLKESMGPPRSEWEAPTTDEVRAILSRAGVPTVGRAGDYLRANLQHPILDKATERSLLKLVAEGVDVRRRIEERCLPIVDAAVGEVEDDGLRSELIRQGDAALIKAVDLYYPESEGRFVEYLRVQVAEALQVYRRDGTDVPMPTHLSEDMDRIAALREGGKRPLSQPKDSVLLDRLSVLSAGAEATATLMAHNQRLVASNAGKHMGRGLEFMELVGEGSIGLRIAIEKYDLTKVNQKTGEPFALSTYATWWVRQTMSRAISEQVRTIRLPEHMNQSISRIRSVSAAMRQKLGRDPTAEEIAEETGMPEDTVHETLAASMLRVVSKEEPIKGGKDGESETRLEDFIADPEEQLDVLASRVLLREKIEKAFQVVNLSDREREVLRLRYGLHDQVEYPLTLEEVGVIFEITRERVRQIEEKALRRMRGNPQVRRLLEDEF